MDRRYLTIPEAAQRIGMSETWVRRACDRGDIPCIRPGKHRRIAVEALQRFLDSHREGAAVRMPVELENVLEG